MISILIPSYNSRQTIGRCLASLYEQSYKGEYEIILVDSSNDGTDQFVLKNFPEVKLIHKTQKTDPGTARNLGIQQARGDLIAFIDADCIAAGNWLDKHVRAHENAYIAVGGSIQNSNESQSAVGYAGYISEFREFIPEQSKMEVNHVPTCNISYKKTAFEKYGFFSGKFYPQEDLVYNFHLVQNKEKILFDPSIEVHHIHRTHFKFFFAHQKRIGSITAQVLDMLDLQGSFLVRHKFVSFPFILCLPLIKFSKTLFVFLKFRPVILFKNPAIVPLFMTGLIGWMWGFVSYTYIIKNQQ